MDKILPQLVVVVCIINDIDLGLLPWTHCNVVRRSTIVATLPLNEIIVLPINKLNLMLLIKLR